jgi:hypothetical protein
MRSACLLFAVSMLAACQSIETEVASSTAPEFRGRRFARICVSTPEDDLLARRAVENAVADELSRAGVEVLLLSELLFPGRDHSEDEVRARVQESGADAFLTVVPLQSWIDTRYVPPTVSSTWDYGRRGHPYGWGYSTTWVAGGYTISRPNATFDVRLLDVASEEIAWVASVSTSGSSGTSWTEMRARAGRAAARQLVRDGLLAVPGAEAPR